MERYYLQDADYNTLLFGHNFNNHTPTFENVGIKHYIKVTDWDYWVSSDPIKQFVLNKFSFATIEDFVSDKFELLDQDEYTAHKQSLANDPVSFINEEWVLCEKVMIAMAITLQTKIANDEINFIQGLQIQDLFAKQEPLSISSIGGVVLNVPVTEYLAQMRSLGGAFVRLYDTPINESIGFTQEIKDEFLTLIQKERDVLNA